MVEETMSERELILNAINDRGGERTATKPLFNPLSEQDLWRAFETELNVLGGSEDVVTTCLAIFSISIAIGSGLAAWLAAGRIILLPTLIGAVLLGLFAIDLGWSTLGAQPIDGLDGPHRSVNLGSTPERQAQRSAPHSPCGESAAEERSRDRQAHAASARRGGQTSQRSICDTRPTKM